MRCRGATTTRGATNFLPPCDRRTSGRARRRLHVRWDGRRVEEDTFENV